MLLAQLARLAVATTTSLATGIQLTISRKQPALAKVSPALGGIGIEDANHEIYGGLWSQMVLGESFEEPA
eukprot:SAG31_NODE_38285_length_297_cov_1.020202_1_plen_70_part_00